ncbi:MAG: glycogen debranching protein GlgX [Rhodoferax sp.]|nr:glycogen debranching protein GlgX [Rhodoferax sp.]
MTERIAHSPCPWPEGLLSAFMRPGRHEPMGSHARDGGVNFAVFSRHAERVEVCVFDSQGSRELARYVLFGPDHGVFHGFLPGAASGLVYGLRAHGPYQPQAGHCFNPNKLLLDPHAREIVGAFRWCPEHHAYTTNHPDGVLSYDTRDNAPHALKARVAPADTPSAGWRNRPRHDSAELVLYEVHVKGFSKRMPGLPEALRGSYAALAHPAAIAHFKSLGVTTLSLLPVQYCIDESALADRALSNYWGYNTLGFFCPDPRLATQREDPSAVSTEFRDMVSRLHEHGLEVVLDVVYNHTAEGDEHGPCLSFRGLDNASWYRRLTDDPSRCENLTGCGNTVNVAHPQVTQFVLDSLRYWVQVMGVDGFRFDLAPVLGRTDTGYQADAAFFTALRQDPVLAQVHWIAEPWDGGPRGYQLGRFPGRFLEWNDKFRDAVRGYWLGTGVTRGELALRFTASSDVFHHSQRLPTASINFVSVHDGYTLADVVSYSHKHNQANGESNRDGRDDELCANFGCEGPTSEPAIMARRERVRRAMMATLLLAQGTPMLCAGDESGNSQQGNNNAYCQDNETGWLDWSDAQPEFTAFVSQLTALRRAEPMLRRAQWWGCDAAVIGESVTWLRPDGEAMGDKDGTEPATSAMACLLVDAAGAPGDATERGRLLLLFSAEPGPIAYCLPAGRWQVLLNSGNPTDDRTDAVDTLLLEPHTLMVLRCTVSQPSMKV